MLQILSSYPLISEWLNEKKELNSLLNPSLSPHSHPFRMYNNRPMGLELDLSDDIGQMLSTLGVIFEGLQDQDIGEELEPDVKEQIKEEIVHLYLRWAISQFNLRLDGELIEDALIICKIIYSEIELSDFDSHCPFISLLAPFIFESDILEKALTDTLMGYVITILELHDNTPRKAKELWEKASRLEVKGKRQRRDKRTIEAISKKYF